MNNKKVQEKTCNTPFPTKKATREEVNGHGSGRGLEMAIKNEPVYAVDRVDKRECFCFCAENFTIEYIKRLHATAHKCEYCDSMGYIENSCKKYPEIQNRQRGHQRIDYVSKDAEELEDDEIVLQVEGAGVKHFLMEGLMCGKNSKQWLTRDRQYPYLQLTTSK